jgi:hypothetical protein
MAHREDPEKVTVEEDERPGSDVNVAVVGTVKLSEGSIVYIPTPTADPRGMGSKSPEFERRWMWIGM